MSPGKAAGRERRSAAIRDALHSFSLEQARTLPSYHPMPSAWSTGYHPMPSAYWGKVHKAAHWGKVYKAADPTAHCTPYSLTPSQAAVP